MSHYQPGFYLIGNGAEAVPVNHAGISREPGHNHFGLMFLRQGLHLVIINLASGVVQAVLHRAVQATGKTHLGPVGQVTTIGQTHAQDGVAGLQQGHIHCGVGLGPGVRLYIGIVRLEQGFGAGDGQLFHRIQHSRSRHSSACGDSLLRTCW